MKRVLLKVSIGFLSLLVCLPFLIQGLTASRQVGEAVELAPRHGKFMRIGEEEIFFQEAGPSSGPVIVFLHGTGSWSELWRPAMERLSSRGYRCVAIDLPPFGFSYSSNRSRIAYDSRSQAKRVLELLAGLNVDRFSLAGHSFGGSTTMEVLLSARDRVEKLLLVNVALGFGKAPGLDPEMPGTLPQLLLRLRWFRNTLASIGIFPGLTKKVTSMFVRDPETITPPVLQMYQSPLYVKGKTEMMGDWMEEFLLETVPSRIRSPESYQSFRIPTKLIWGELDPITPLWQGQEINKWFQESVLSVIPKVSHIPMIENQDEFFALVDAFFP